MNTLQKMYKSFAFLAIYIDEAHANDVWPLGTKICINRPKTIEARLEVANNFVRDYHFKIPVLVDELDNNFDLKYAAWPERYYVIDQGCMKYIASPTTEFGYDRDVFIAWLGMFEEQYISSKDKSCGS